MMPFGPFVLVDGGIFTEDGFEMILGFFPFANGSSHLQGPPHKDLGNRINVIVISNESNKEPIDVVIIF